MKLKTRTTYWTAWIVSVCILIQSLVPAVAAEVARFNGVDTFLVEICSANKLNHGKFISLKKNIDAPSDSQTSHQSHCPLCVTHHMELSWLPSGQLVLPLIKASFAFPSLFYQTAHLVFIWAAPQSRAPPV